MNRNIPQLLDHYKVTILDSVSETAFIFIVLTVLHFSIHSFSHYARRSLTFSQSHTVSPPEI